MRYLTHDFAHSETLDRARRWLIHAGVSPDRMQVHRYGIPRLAVAAFPAEVQSIEMIIRIAEMNDPDGQPGFWDLARVHPVDAEGIPGVTAPAVAARPSSFPLAWHSVDLASDDEARPQVELQKGYREGRP
jgi:hypothetical protein